MADLDERSWTFGNIWVLCNCCILNILNFRPPPTTFSTKRLRSGYWSQSDEILATTKRDATDMWHSFHFFFSITQESLPIMGGINGIPGDNIGLGRTWENLEISAVGYDLNLDFERRELWEKFRVCKRLCATHHRHWHWHGRHRHHRHRWHHRPRSLVIFSATVVQWERRKTVGRHLSAWRP